MAIVAGYDALVGAAVLLLGCGIGTLGAAWPSPASPTAATSAGWPLLAMLAVLTIVVLGVGALPA
jgi:uncharacterized ion transporter superfamily protein YfcC